MAVLVLGFVCAMLAGVAGLVVVRGVRRRYRSTRASLGALRVAPPSPPDLHGLMRASGSAAVGTLGSPGWWLIQNRRHQMWRAVSSAQHAVSVARGADVAVGDLPALASQLNAAASGVDAVLRASGRHGSLRAEDRRDCD